VPGAVFVPAALNDLSVDVAVGSPAQGAVFYRGATKWNSLAAGTNGQVLTSGGAAANPSWTTLSSTFAGLADVSVPGVAQGAVLYRGASAFNALAAGTSGQYLTSGGAAANPLWATLPTTLSGDVTLAPSSVNRNLIVPTADTNKGLVLRGFSATQSANFIEVQKSDSTLLGRWAPDGSMTLGGVYPNVAKLTINSYSGTGPAIVLNDVGNGTTASIQPYTGNSIYFPSSGGIIVPKITSAASGNSITDTTFHWIFGSGVNSTFQGSGGTDPNSDAFSATPSWPLAANYRAFSSYGANAVNTFTLPTFQIDTNGAMSWAALNTAPDLMTGRASAGQWFFTSLDTATNTITPTKVWRHNTSGTPAAGYGSSLGVQLQSSTTINRNAAQMQTQWIVATDATRTARYTLFASDFAADRECLRIEASGTAAMIGFLGHAAQARPAAYTITNPVSNRSFDTTTVTLAQLAQVVGTLLADMQGFGLVG